MKILVKFLTPGLLLFVVFMGCKRDDIDMDQLSEEFVMEQNRSLPSIYGEFSFKELVDNELDAFITIEGDTTFGDTTELGLGDELENLTIDQFEIAYELTNGVPIGMNIFFILYDSSSQSIIDTIKLTSQELLLEPATDNGDGTYSSSTNTDIASVDAAIIEKLFNVATHLIFQVRLVSETTSIVPLNDDFMISMVLKISAKGTYINQ